MTRALVLSGGACKGSYQVGVLRRWMRDEGREYDIFAGVSVGALNCALLGQFSDPVVAQEELERIWRSITTRDVYRRHSASALVFGAWKHSLFDSSPLRELVKRNIDTARFVSSGKRVAVGAVCLETGEKVFGTETAHNFSEWVLASASYPVFFSPISIDGRLWVDGAVKNMTPLGRAIEMGATEIDMILCSNMSTHTTVYDMTKLSIHKQVSRIVDITSDQVLRSDLQVTALKNELAAVGSQYKKVSIRLVQPASRLIENSFDFEPQSIKRMAERGYVDALAPSFL